MRCPHSPGKARRLGRCLWPAALGLALTLATTVPAHAAPTSAKTAQPAASAPSPKKPAKKKAATGSGKVVKKTSKTPARTQAGSKKHTAQRAAAAGTGAAAAAAATDTADRDPPESGIRLPLMLRVTPSLPDNPAALQSRLDQIVARQGEGSQGAAVGSVRQLGPDIYAFSLQCADAEQCQRLRLAIESERDWVAGLQLDERRHIPRTPDRHSPTAR